MHSIIISNGFLNLYIEYRQSATCERELHLEQNPKIKNMQKWLSFHFILVFKYVFLHFKDI